VQRLRDERSRLQSRAAPGSAAAEKLDAVVWDIEELRVSLFAQRLRTAYPISEKRVRNALAAAAALIDG
jgi:ATP-dependent helicase HrpA